VKDEVTQRIACVKVGNGGLPSIHLSTSNPNLLSSVDLTDSSTSGLGTSVSPSVSTVDSGSASATAADKLQEQFYSQAKDGQYRWVLSRKIVDF